MKLKIIGAMLYSILLLNMTKLHATENMITMFIRQFPMLTQEDVTNKPNQATYSAPLQQPDFTQPTGTTKPHKAAGSGYEGVTASYLGYISVTNHNGQISFPRKQQSSSVYILVTPRILPIFMIAPTTIHHWQLHPSMPAELYKVEQKADEITGLYYFTTIKQTLPKDHKIDMNTIIIYADPNEVVVPEGATITKYTTNLTLPNIYVKNINITKASLYALSIKEYFEQINEMYKNSSLDVATMITNT